MTLHKMCGTLHHILQNVFYLEDASVVAIGQGVLTRVIVRTGNSKTLKLCDGSRELKVLLLCEEDTLFKSK